MSGQTLPTQVERPFPAGQTLVSKTDLDGKIVYANEALTTLSGYAENELIGLSHNIMRHPDVPAAVFAHLWKTLSRGRPWRGVVKNLCKNGDHYWSDAYIVPLRQQGKAIGYMSARTAPTAEQIRAAEADYAYAAKHGVVPAEAGFHPMRYLSVKRGVLTGILFVLAATAVSAWFGVKGLEKTSQLVYELQRQNDVAALVTKGNQQAASTLSNILLALQHAPGKQPSGDSLELKEHLDLIRAGAEQLAATTTQISDSKTLLRRASRQTEIIVPDFAARTAATEMALEAYVRASTALRTEGIAPVAAMIEQSRFADVQALIIDRLGPLGIELNQKADAVSGSLFKSSIELRRTVDDLYDTTLDRLIYWSLFTALVVGLSGILFFRATMRPLTRAMRQMQQIAEGNLSEKPDVFGFGETGKVASTVATMQIQLKVMLDEIHVASNVVREQVKHLNSTVISILNNTEDQYDQAVQINAALASSGADTTRLADIALQAAELARRAEGTTDDVNTDLVRLTHETASLANLNALAAAEIHRLAGKIMELVAANREHSNDSWVIGQKLDEMSKQLAAMLEKFDQR